MLKDKVREILKNGEYAGILASLDFSDDDNLFNIGFDSLSFVSFIVDLEDQFSVSFEVDELDFEKINSISNIAEMVEAKLNS